MLYFTIIVTVREINIIDRTKNFIVRNRLWQVISEKKKFFDEKCYDYFERKFNQISENKQKKYVN